jgi:hypothetical protein
MCFVDDEALSCGLNHAPGSYKPAWNNELHTYRELLGSAVLVGEDTSAFEDAAVLLLCVLNLPLANFAGPDSGAELAVVRLVLDPDLLLRIAGDELVLADVVDLRLLGRSDTKTYDAGLMRGAQAASPVMPNVRVHPARGGRCCKPGV